MSLNAIDIQRTRIWEFDLDTTARTLSLSCADTVAGAIDAPGATVEESGATSNARRLVSFAVVVLSGSAQYSLSGDNWFTLTPVFEPPFTLAATNGKKQIKFKGADAARLQVIASYVI